MVCRLFGIAPSTELTSKLMYCKLNPSEHTSVNFNQNIKLSFNEIFLKMSPAKYQTYCLRPHVLNTSRILPYKPMVIKADHHKLFRISTVTLHKRLCAPFHWPLYGLFKCLIRLITKHHQKPCWLLALFAGSAVHDDVIKWKHFPRYWPFVRGIHRSPVNSPHKGQWRGALMFSFIYARINGWVNNAEAGELRRHRAHYDAIVMGKQCVFLIHSIGPVRWNVFPCHDVIMMEKYFPLSHWHGDNIVWWRILFKWS